MKKTIAILGFMMMFATFAKAGSVYCTVGSYGTVTAYNDNTGSTIYVTNDSNERVTVTVYWRTACGGSGEKTITLESGDKEKIVASTINTECAISPVKVSGGNCK